MEEKKVAGTVMLHLADGSKRFLMCEEDSKTSLASTDFSEEQTGLANILQLLKESVHLDISHISLLELTNGHVHNRNLPIFVFETKEQEQPSVLPKTYEWKEAKVFRQIIQEYQIDGMPFF